MPAPEFERTAGAEEATVEPLDQVLVGPNDEVRLPGASGQKPVLPRAFSVGVDQPVEQAEEITGRADEVVGHRISLSLGWVGVGRPTEG